MISASFGSVMSAIFLLAAPASGQRLRIAIHPLTAPGIDDVALIKDLEAEARDILVATGRITPVNADDVVTQLAGDGGKCSPPADNRVKCLQRLALTTRAEYSLAVELKKFGKSYELSALLVPRNGEAITQPEAIPILPPATAPPAAVFKAELRRLLIDKMGLSTIPPAPVTDLAVKSVPEAAPRAPALGATATPQTSALRAAAFVTGGLTLVAAAAAIGFSASSTSDAAAIEANARARGQSSAPFSITAAELDQARSLRSKNSTAQVLGAVAATTAATTIVLWLVGAPSTAVVPSVTPSAGGAVISLSGSY